jgi:CRISPR-associated endonuclease/helicase Cas3
MMSDSLPGYYKYWAKTTKDDQPGIDVSQHMLRVATVAGMLGNLFKLTDRFNLDPTIISFLAGLHDVGKISPGFQSKCKIWLEENGLLDESVRDGWVNLERDHSIISQFTIQRLLTVAIFNLPRANAIWWAAAIGAHHGRLHFPGDRGLAERAGMCVDEWESKRQKAAAHLLQMLNLKFENIAGALPDIEDESPFLWLIAGLVSVADWIGSDETFFSPDQDFTLDEIQLNAKRSLEVIGLGLPEIRPGLNFEELFSFSSNSLQRAATEYIKTPGIYVIEAPMGMGKTEAALASAYQLICAGNATGIYFALPTQATSNRIHIRLADFVKKISPDSPTTKLIHSNSWLIDNMDCLKPSHTSKGAEDARQGRDWFASAKRALIAPFGVGTVDQALLSVVAAKHFFVRRFALAGKVVIIDEVHSYDIYTGSLIENLCSELLKLGCTIIILSATLTRPRRNTFIESESYLNEDEILEPYPLISGKTSYGQTLPSIKAESPQQKKVFLNFIEEDKTAIEALEYAKKGACVLWICNTVARAQQIFRNLHVLKSKNIKMGLLHARFPYYRRMELEKDWMLALGKDGPRPNGCILVSTQIVEQSVDLDADLIITELAPTDMLLQRMGRLWRHERDNRPISKPEYWIISEKKSLQSLKNISVSAIKETLGTKARVYAPYILLRSLEAWAGRDWLILPDEIRKILKDTYCDKEKQPVPWLELRNEIEGEGYAKRMKAQMASNIFNPALPDEEGVQTRINEMPAVSLVLGQSIDGYSITLINGGACLLKGEDFRINDARALHRNLVRVPKWIFEDFHRTDITARYIKGDQAIAVVDKGGSIDIRGLKQGIDIIWDEITGIEIIQDKEDTDESCD